MGSLNKVNEVQYYAGRADKMVKREYISVEGEKVLVEVNYYAGREDRLAREEWNIYPGYVEQVQYYEGRPDGLVEKKWNSE